jgi:hypothetical protein
MPQQFRLGLKFAWRTASEGGCYTRKREKKKKKKKKERGLPVG